jgi:CheY-like chemotaxis protein
MAEKEILFVDDEEQILKLFATSFQDFGYKVETATNGEQALKIMKNHTFPLVFSDLNMPRMSGVELCRRIRKDWPMTIVIAVTGYASLFELADCRDAGFEDYFTKPVNLKDLLAEADHSFRKIERWKRRLD